MHVKLITQQLTVASHTNTDTLYRSKSLFISNTFKLKLKA